MCAHFLSHLLLLYIGKVHGANSGCTDLGEVHPVSAQNKSLISDTVRAYSISRRYCRPILNKALSKGHKSLSRSLWGTLVDLQSWIKSQSAEYLPSARG